ncbi:unnamed protein product [Aphanomyces euteiches]
MVALWEDKTTALSVEPTPAYASMQELSTDKGSHLGVWDQTILLIQRNSFSGVLFFIVINQVMMPASSEFVAVPLDLPILSREYKSSLYSATTWYMAKNVSELAFQIVFPIIFLIPLYFMIGFGPTNASVFFSLYVFIVLLNSTATRLGYMVSCIVRRADLAPVIGIVMLLPLVLFGGIFINADDTPDYLVWLVYISPFKYGYVASCVHFGPL